MEFEPGDEGRIAKILVAEGTDEVKVGTVIALIAGDGEDVSAATAPKQEAKPPVEQPSDQKTEASPPETGDQQQPQETGAHALVAAAHDNPEPPDVPEGTETVRQTVREALRDAMAEEMRSDERVFVMGE